jgi:hypothetical protein
MDPRFPERDPGAARVRKARVKRRVGVDGGCPCGETRPEALIPNSDPKVCAACDRKKKGKTIVDNHHVAGKSNSPTTVPIPVNDHRAELSVAQQEAWPSGTLENPHGSPLLAAAAGLRGFRDTVLHLMEKLLLWAADMLEQLDAFLQERRGPKWWVDTPVEQFAPKRNDPGAS